MKKRRTELETAITAAAEERERKRQRMVVTATKARIDAMTPRFRSIDKIQSEVEAARDKRLDSESMSEIEKHAELRRQALADEILTLAIPKLSDVPETLEGLSQLINLIDTVIDETKVASSASALESFEQTATEVSSQLGRKLLDAFKAELVALAEDRDGMQTAHQATEWAKGRHRVEEDLRNDYIDAAQNRYDEIVEKLAAAEAERRKRVLAAGGDPELVGLTFANKKAGTTLEFVDEKRVIFAAFGMRFGGKYEVVKDDIFVEGPNGTVVFAREGSKLTGMGLDLDRVEK